MMPTTAQSDFVTNAEIYDNDIESCGLYDYEFNDGGENGEGICEWTLYGNMGLSVCYYVKRTVLYHSSVQ